MQKVGSTAAKERGPQWATEEQTSLVLLPSSWSKSTHRRRQEGSLPTRVDGQKLVVHKSGAEGREASLATAEMLAVLAAYRSWLRKKLESTRGMDSGHNPVRPFLDKINIGTLPLTMG